MQQYQTRSFLKKTERREHGVLTWAFQRCFVFHNFQSAEKNSG